MNSLLPTSNLRALTRPKGNYSNSVMTVSRGMISQPYPYNANIKKPNKANDYGCFKYPITQGGTSWQNYTEAEKLKEKNQFRIRESR